MLDHEPIHIDNPERAIRTGADLHRTKPVVSGGQKFRMLLIGRTRGRECHTIAPQNEPVHQVMDWLADKCVPSVLGAQRFVAIDFQATGGRCSIGRVQVVESFQGAARRIKLIGIRLPDRVNSRLGCGHMRVASQIVIGHREVPD